MADSNVYDKQINDFRFITFETSCFRPVIKFGKKYQDILTEVYRMLQEIEIEFVSSMIYFKSMCIKEFVSESVCVKTHAQAGNPIYTKFGISENSNSKRFFFLNFLESYLF